MFCVLVKENSTCSIFGALDSEQEMAARAEEKRKAVASCCFQSCCQTSQVRQMVSSCFFFPHPSHFGV